MMLLVFVVMSCFSSFCVLLFYLFFFKQKTAYEMRISDWSSDVCSSDLAACCARPMRLGVLVRIVGDQRIGRAQHAAAAAVVLFELDYQIGRASCRERVCQYV